MSPLSPLVGDFSFMTSMQRECQDAWDTVNANPEFVEYVKSKSPQESWAYTSNPTAMKIMSSLKCKDQHSGASIACTMRAIEFIFRYGWNKFVEREAA